MDAPQDLPNLDKTIVKLPEDLRQDLAVRLSRDLYVFAKSVLGYKDLTPRAHGPMCVFLDRNPSRFKMVLMPRDHYKTTVGTIARRLQGVCQDVESRSLIANEVGKNANRFLGVIRQHAESNAVFRALYSHIIPKDFRKVKWNDEELVFRREGHYPEPTIDSIGMTGTMTSRHYTHITFDDPISEEAVKSESVMKDTISRMHKLLALFVKPEEDTFDLIGTRWAFHDCYSDFELKYGTRLAKLIRSVIDENGDLIFPELLSKDTLALLRQNLGEYVFSCLYLNNPRNEEIQDFNVNDLRWYAWDGDHTVVLFNNARVVDVWHLSQLDIVTTVDPAAAESTTSDRNAITTCGVSPKRQAIVLDSFVRRVSPLKVIEYLLYVNLRFHPRVFGIEDVAYQKTLKHFLRDAAMRLGTYLNVVPVKTSNRSKAARIRGLQPVAATGHLYLHPSQHMLRNELSDFPLGQFDDAIDSLAMQMDLWQADMSIEGWRRYAESERKVLQTLAEEGQYTGTGMRSLPRTQVALDEGDDEPWQPGSWREEVVA